MIQVIQGFGVGAGKSYLLLNRIINHVVNGGTVVITDQFGLYVDKLAEYVANEYGLQMAPEQVRVVNSADTWRLHEVTPQGTEELPVLIILDEAHSQLNARDWNDPQKRGFFVWLTQSRHDDCDVLFSTQNIFNLDKQVARLVTNVINVRNMANFRILGIGRWRPNWFRVNVFDQNGRDKLEHYWLKKDPKKFALYNSKAMRGRHKRAGEVCTRKKLNKVKRKHPMLKFALIIIALIGTAVGVMWHFNGDKLAKGGINGMIFGTVKPTDEPKKQVEQKPKAKLPPVRVTPVQPRQNVFVETFRGTDYRTFLHTDAENYEVGSACSRGLVVRILHHAAAIQGLDGSHLVVVAREADKPSQAPAQPVATSAVARPLPEPEKPPVLPPTLVKQP